MSYQMPLESTSLEALDIMKAICFEVRTENLLCAMQAIRELESVLRDLHAQIVEEVEERDL